MSAWEPQEPPRDFAEKVLAAARASENHVQDTREEARHEAHLAPPPRMLRGGSRRALGFAALTLAAAAALALIATTRAPSRGEAIARERTQLPIGARAAAVLEPGAHVAWTGDDVTQTAGDVFYRVEPGAPFRVHTDAGDVTVKGTCFRVRVSPPKSQERQNEESDVNKRDIRSGSIGAALSALAIVVVYEGKVAVSHAGQSVTLAPGESARADATGVHAAGVSGASGADMTGAIADEDPFAQANRNLVDSVKDYKDRLTAIEAQKKALEAQLKSAEDKLGASQHDGQAPSQTEREYDLSQDDWKELAKDGTVRTRIPCTSPDSWTYSPNTLQKLGLSPDDAPMIHDALARSTKRTWATLRPLCTQALAGSAEMADKLGASTCQALVLDVARHRGDDVDEALRRVAEMRAGIRPTPPIDAQSTVERMMLAYSSESKSLEGDLAQTLGPSDAHRVVFADVGCWNNTSFSAGPRKE